MQALWQGILEFLQKFFMLIGSLVTFGVLFYLGITLASWYDYWAKQRQTSSRDLKAEERINRYATIIHVVFWILGILASIGIIIFNFVYVGKLGGMLAVVVCLAINLFALAD